MFEVEYKLFEENEHSDTLVEEKKTRERKLCGSISSMFGYVKSTWAKSYEDGRNIRKLHGYISIVEGGETVFDCNCDGEMRTFTFGMYIADEYLCKTYDSLELEANLKEKYRKI